MLKDRVALITGGSRGIGRATALAMAREGGKVVINYHESKREAQEAALKIREMGGHCLIHKADVANQSEVKDMIEEVLDRFDSIDILVNNAGVLIDGGFLTEFDISEFEPMWEVNVKGVIYASRLVAPIFIEQNYGKIVNIASVAGIGTASRPGNLLYAATKGAIITITKELAMDLGEYSINVNAIAPGLIRTDMGLHGEPEEEQKERLDYYRRNTLFSRLGEPEEIAEVAVFLSSDKASFITGQVITVDGGRIDLITHST